MPAVQPSMCLDFFQFFLCSDLLNWVTCVLMKGLGLAVPDRMFISRTQSMQDPPGCPAHLPLSTTSGRDHLPGVRGEFRLHVKWGMWHTACFRFIPTGSSAMGVVLWVLLMRDGLLYNCNKNCSYSGRQTLNSCKSQRWQENSRNIYIHFVHIIWSKSWGPY